MAQPTKKAPETLYRSTETNGKYYVSYRAKSGNNPAGIPLASDTDLINLTKVGGSTNAPPFIVTSEADFKANFTEYNPISTTGANPADRDEI
jgi:hypothetical protein